MVSIPSQAGTLFGPPTFGRPLGSQEVSIPSQAGTLFGQHGHERRWLYRLVSIPSQAGTLFGRLISTTTRGGLLSQYPLRRAPSSDPGSGGLRAEGC